jgi:hypothetical protein
MASSLKARLKRVAVTVGACPVHGMLLQCVCQWRWAGTEDEWQELVPLAERIAPYLDETHPQAIDVAVGSRSGVHSAMKRPHGRSWYRLISSRLRKKLDMLHC